ncbi:MAG: hypothetical protein P4L84_09040 [Isosphaeraceae bacterium]|nr:hypothetical protein [Isosphaeraceae bacterium]
MITIRGWGLGLALAALAAGVAMAQQVGALSAREFFELLDANRDQVIEKCEVPESGQAAFERLLKNGDANKNGRLEQNEYRALVSSIGNPGSSSPVPAADEFGQRFARADRNGDGKLSKDEWPGQPEAFARADTDKDGFVAKDEARKFFVEQGGAGAGGGILERLKAMDKNGDGKVSKEEFTGPEPMFARIDANRDGVISKEEAETFRPGAGPDSPDRFKAMDKNGDGKLSRDEFEGPPAAFDRLDTDGDGVITLLEIREGRQEAAKKAAAKKHSQ